MNKKVIKYSYVKNSSNIKRDLEIAWTENMSNDSDNRWIYCLPSHRNVQLIVIPKSERGANQELNLSDRLLDEKPQKITGILVVC